MSTSDIHIFLYKSPPFLSVAFCLLGVSSIKKKAGIIRSMQHVIIKKAEGSRNHKLIIYLYHERAPHVSV